MRRFLLSIVLVVAAGVMRAAGYSYLTFYLTDGTSQTVSALGTKITYSVDKVVVENSGKTLSLELADVDYMIFSDTDPTGVELAAADGCVVTGGDGRISVSSPKDAAVVVYGVNGAVADEFEARGGRVSQSKTLPGGCYMVKVGNAVKKVAL